MGSTDSYGPLLENKRLLLCTKGIYKAPIKSISYLDPHFFLHPHIGMQPIPSHLQVLHFLL